VSRIVAIDIETTGLDPDHDSIIEIGAILFNERRVEAEWSSLINPQQPIPSPIIALTGITNEMVRNAPLINAVIEDLVKFVGTDPILGHNIQFDLSFLRKQNIFIYNDSIDTYEMASVLLPKISRYNLKSLGQELGILFPATHRALDDARVTHGVFIKLLEKAKEIPLELIQELVHYSESFDWGGSWVFNKMLENSSQPLATNSSKLMIDYTQFQKCTSPREYPPLIPQETPEKLDPEEVAGFLDYGGKFAQYFNGYEHRPEQIEMVRAVSGAL
jgi:ATP-dependent DNA helicase DinG